MIWRAGIPAPLHISSPEEHRSKKQECRDDKLPIICGLDANLGHPFNLRKHSGHLMQAQVAPNREDHIQPFGQESQQLLTNSTLADDPYWGDQADQPIFQLRIPALVGFTHI